MIPGIVFLLPCSNQRAAIRNIYIQEKIALIYKQMLYCAKPHPPLRQYQIVWRGLLFFGFFEKQCICFSTQITCREIKKKEEKKKTPLNKAVPALYQASGWLIAEVFSCDIYILSNQRKYEDLISNEKRIYTKNRHNKAKLIHHNFHISLCWAVGQAHHIICLTQ